jgi:hypothetical protein
MQNALKLTYLHLKFQNFSRGYTPDPRYKREGRRQRGQERERGGERGEGERGRGREEWRKGEEKGKERERAQEGRYGKFCLHTFLEKSAHMD